MGVADVLVMKIELLQGMLSMVQANDKVPNSVAQPVMVPRSHNPPI